MIKSIEITGKTEEEAIAAALKQLDMTREEVSVEILERSKSGMFGIGASPALIRVSYEYIEPKSEQAKTFLTGLFEKMGLDATPNIVKDDGDRIEIVIEGKNIGGVIGHRGETLDAIQLLTNYTINKSGSDRVRINIDAENYRAKRAAALEKLADKIAAKVIKYRRNVTLEPMNAYERHIIHAALQDRENISTYSIGDEPNRRIVVAYNAPPRKEYTTREWA